EQHASRSRLKGCVKLRRLYEYGRESSEARARNFYRQAVFMEDYEDDYPWSGGDFVRYFPTYHDLTLKQLRGYFTWRTGVRRGTFKPIAASAAYIYIYELLNGVGADSPEDVLKKLRDFEVGYLDSGIGDQRIRGNLHRWMLEYAVVNDLSPDLVRESADTETMARDAAIAVLRRPENYSDEEVFSALCLFGGNKIAESPAMKEDPEKGRHLFSEAWRFAARPDQENDQFALCFGERKTRRWYPLSNAVYYEQKQAEDREYILNESRSFQCKGGIWTMSAYESLSYDKKRLPGFLHETDARLRRYLKTGRYLKEKPENAWAISYIDAAIEEDKKAVLEASGPKITIDLSGLDQIRRDALVTQESLLTEEEIGEAAFSLQEFGAAREVIASTAENGYELTDMSASTSAENGYELTDMTAPTTVENNYQQTDKTLFPAPEDDMIDIPLDNIQIQILRALLDGRDPSEIIRENHRMPSVEADAINEAFYDEIGDTVLFCEGDQLILVEDYIEDVMRAVPRTL
ncbi:MAG: TerB N-terminal domain-containing protein, partial [Lachnospiraceae bacterium]|nr:TerB N-terminal domain-containing protein [Lachnospiraceae bacterium]